MLHARRRVPGEVPEEKFAPVPPTSGSATGVGWRPPKVERWDVQADWRPGWGKGMASPTVAPALGELHEEPLEAGRPKWDPLDATHLPTPDDGSHRRRCPRRNQRCIQEL